MKIKFTGIKQTKKAGCPVCGTSKGVRTYKRRERFYLPSGRVEIFIAGETVTINDSDGKWLIENFESFEEVNVSR